MKATEEQARTLWWSVHSYHRKLDNLRSASFGRDSCPCCSKWHPHNVFPSPEVECGGCPIQQHTGQSLCLGTPYDHIALTLQEVSWSVPAAALLSGFRKQVLKEYEFLVDLACSMKTE